MMLSVIRSSKGIKQTSLIISPHVFFILQHSKKLPKLGAVPLLDTTHDHMMIELQISEISYMFQIARKRKITKECDDEVLRWFHVMSLFLTGF
jgi:hypothetical protein